MRTIIGLHHVTAIAGPAQRALDFHTGVLSRRLVKTTVNFDEPHIYHLYFGNHSAPPAGIFTLFPFEHAVPGHPGVGTPSGFAYRASVDALEAVSVQVREARSFVRFGDRGLRLHDPDGIPVEIIAPAEATETMAHAQFHSVTLMVREAARTTAFLTEVFGWTVAGEERDEEGRRTRLAAPGDAPGRFVDVVEPDIPVIAKAGAGSIHHVAFRAADEEALAEWREAVHDWGLKPTAILDRQYFRSVYFVEPGGILVEIATDPPGFTVDEAADSLGTSLKLPPRYEPRRAEIEAALPRLRRHDLEGAV